ncbi:MAG: LytTR family DNA-binding domain-containing protein [Planctomycetia bacterium]
MRTALLVDDEPAARRRLAELLAAHPRIEVIGMVESVEEARIFLAARIPDIVFLDVEMPRGSGLGLLESLPDSVRVCFVTAYPEYAVDAFDFGAVHYLLKPVDPLRLEKAITRLLKTDASDPGLEPDIKVVIEAGNDSKVSVVASQNGQKVVIQLSDMLWIEAMGNYSHVCANDGQIPLVFRRSLAQWETLLPAGKFVRIGRSHLIHFSRIALVRWKSRDETLLFFAGSEQRLSIGRHAAIRLRELLDA